jgi:hypothetical protein
VGVLGIPGLLPGLPGLALVPFSIVCHGGERQSVEQ